VGIDIPGVGRQSGLLRMQVWDCGLLMSQGVQAGLETFLISLKISFIKYVKAHTKLCLFLQP
jgi:hypothetical protein